jgi:hypothetical protein
VDYRPPVAGDASPYSALGLEPGAEPAAVERAYKSLIKRYHPDREGGDPHRAAEINRAYRELRAGFVPMDTLILADDDLDAPRGNAWVRAAMGLIVAIAALLAITGPVAAYIRALLPPSAQPLLPPGQAAPVLDSMDQSLHLVAIDAAIGDAVRAGRDDSKLLGWSRECHRQLRLEPSVTQLDRCAAFDDAVIELQNRAPMWDRGPFSQIAVTSRQWSAASTLSNDFLAIDGRLDRIRVHVELALAVPAPPSVTPTVPFEPEPLPEPPQPAR